MTVPDAVEVTSPPRATLPEALDPDAVHDEIRTQLLADADAAVAARVSERVEAFRAYVLAQAMAIPVEEDQQWTLALAYLELKSQWMQRQVRVCYEEMMTGACDREVALEASAVSLLLARIEPLLEPLHQQRIHEIFVSQLA